MEIRKQRLWQALIILPVLAVASCNLFDDSPRPAPTPDMTGIWHGAYTSLSDQSNTFSFDINITNQQDSDFGGIWRWSTSASWPTDYTVDGFTYPSNDGGTLVDITLIRGGDITCCVPLFGCYISPLESIAIFGYLINDSITDMDATHWYGCGSADHGEVIITLEPGLI